MLHVRYEMFYSPYEKFQRAPTLGGECYVEMAMARLIEELRRVTFQRAPTLGGECYLRMLGQPPLSLQVSTGTHPWG